MQVALAALLVVGLYGFYQWLTDYSPRHRPNRISQNNPFRN